MQAQITLTPTQAKSAAALIRAIEKKCNYRTGQLECYCKQTIAAMGAVSILAVKHQRMGHIRFGSLKAQATSCQVDMSDIDALGRTVLTFTSSMGTAETMSDPKIIRALQIASKEVEIVVDVPKGKPGRKSLSEDAKRIQMRLGVLPETAANIEATIGKKCLAAKIDKAFADPALCENIVIISGVTH